MVTLGPIAQLGWASASARVAAAIRSALHWRNGPPDAVMVMRMIVARSRPPSAWKIALCSESIGSRRAPVLRAVAITASPAHTSVSLLASATARPAETAA